MRPVVTVMLLLVSVCTASFFWRTLSDPAVNDPPNICRRRKGLTGCWLKTCDPLRHDDAPTAPLILVGECWREKNDTLTQHSFPSTIDEGNGEITKNATTKIHVAPLPMQSRPAQVGSILNGTELVQGVAEQLKLHVDARRSRGCWEQYHHCTHSGTPILAQVHASLSRATCHPYCITD